VKRAEKVTINAYGENGEKIIRGASKLLAQIFQHEVEHLDGKLFIDRARNIEEIPPEDQGEKT
jgi:peptide deformylase